MSWFNLFEKKRGERRTGSQIVYTFGEALLLIGVFLFGFIGLAALIAAQTLLSTPEEWFLDSWKMGLLILVFGSMVSFGGWLLARTVWRSSGTQERREALKTQASKLAPFALRGHDGHDRPTVPMPPMLTDSPGVVLAFRLPVTQHENWRLLAAALFSPLWGAANAWMIVQAIQNARVGSVDWLLLTALAPFTAVSIWAVAYLFRQFLFYTAIGPTGVEVSALPMIPGETYQLFVSQVGRIQLKRLEISLVCEEEAQFHQGTDIRKETTEVFSKVLYEGVDVTIVPEQSFEKQFELEIPNGAMHSFASPSNAVSWRICVAVDFPREPGFRRKFPLVVYPKLQEA